LKDRNLVLRNTKFGKLSIDLRASVTILTESFAALRQSPAYRRLGRFAAGAVEKLFRRGPDKRQCLRNMVVEGKDEFLFHRDHEAVEQVTGALTYSPAQLEQWISTLETRKAWCDTHGIRSRFLIVPEKHVVYADKLPEGIAISDQRPAALLMRAATPLLSGHIIYPLEAMLEARTRRQTHCITDTHWNMFGAFTAYRELMTSLSQDIEVGIQDESELSFIPQPYVGDLGVRFEPERSEIIEALTRGYGPTCRLLFQNKKFERGNVQVFVNDRPGLPTCVLFRDSFAYLLIPLLLESFSRLVAVSSLSVLYDLLRLERPDVVIVQAAERFLGTYWNSKELLMPQDIGGPSFFEFTGIELDMLQGP
jgi:alginate O-acetyltransferase complex protein AlgJ